MTDVLYILLLIACFLSVLCYIAWRYNFPK